MRIQITVQAFDDLAEGTPVVWGFHIEEQIPEEPAEGVDFLAIIAGEREPTRGERKALEQAANRNSGLLLDAMLKRIDEARESIVAQAAAGLPRRGAGRP